MRCVSERSRCVLGREWLSRSREETVTALLWHLDVFSLPHSSPSYIHLSTDMPVSSDNSSVSQGKETCRIDLWNYLVAWNKGGIQRMLGARILYIRVYSILSAFVSNMSFYLQNNPVRGTFLIPIFHL